MANLERLIALWDQVPNKISGKKCITLAEEWRWCKYGCCKPGGFMKHSRISKTGKINKKSRKWVEGRG